eukprot:4066462-Amphidinium_carterae.1
MDMRSKRPAKELGFTDEDFFVVPPWWHAQKALKRRMNFISAYQGTGFTNWGQGPFAASAQSIAEVSLDTLGSPSGSKDAIDALRDGIEKALARVSEADKEGATSYTYIYTAHPDKHMHCLGVEHAEVGKVVQGFDLELARLWKSLEGKDAALVITADHSHITVCPEHMVTLPPEALAYLEYANVGVHGKGRHAVLHTRPGQSQAFLRVWAKTPQLTENFLLLTVEEASARGLFGPDEISAKVRP